MKNIHFLIASLLLAITNFTRADTIGFFLDAGILSDNTASHNPISNGSLVLLIASPDGSGFTTPVIAGSYVAGNSIILAGFSYSTPNSPYLPGEVVADATTTPTLDGLTVPSGYRFALRWFPEVTYAQYKNSSFSTVAGIFYGTYSGPSDSSSVNAFGGNAWKASGDGGYSLYFFTSNVPDTGSTLNPSLGYADLQVLAIPEPSSVVQMAGGLLAVGAWVRRRRAA